MNYLVDSLIINYSQGGIWKMKLLLPGNIIDYPDFIYITGFSYFILFLLPIGFIFIFGLILHKFRRIPVENINAIEQKIPEINKQDLEKIKIALEFMKS